ncbi:MAG TPA: HDOD domain-containing protein [Planctomycetota bacterium]|nr:HDOD domain-containing protein [Planctomycetota bacterium]
MSNPTLAQLAQQERTRREILHKSDLIPPLPDVVIRVLRLLDRPDTEPAQLESCLCFDQVLVAKMLGMVNSPFYGLRHPVGTVREAIMVLGFRGLRSLILATSAAKFLARDFRCYGFADRGLWLHSITVAAGARLLARRTGADAELGEQLFVAGLLHDIGKMLLAPYLTERRATVPPGAPGLEVERAVAGIDHTEAGALVAAKWNITPLVQEVVKLHHTADVGSASEREACIVQAADRVANALGFGHAPGVRAEPIEAADAVLGRLGIAPDDRAAVRAELAEAMERAVATMTAVTG